MIISYFYLEIIIIINLLYSTVIIKLLLLLLIIIISVFIWPDFELFYWIYFVRQTHKNVFFFFFSQVHLQIMSSCVYTKFPSPPPHVEFPKIFVFIILLNVKSVSAMQWHAIS